MSAIYQDEEFAITEQDLALIELEIEGRAEQVYIKCSDELYLETLLSKWEDEDRPTLTEDEEREWLEYENERLESDLLEQEENSFL